MQTPIELIKAERERKVSAEGWTPVNYPLFEHLSREHGLTLLDSELHEICLVVDEMAWRAVDSAMPDSDETVIVFAPVADEPVWLGYHDGYEWRDVSGEKIEVTHWRPLCGGPNAKVADPKDSAH